MEYVRRHSFPQLPSRMDCAFFFDSIGEARFYRNSDPGRTMINLYEIDLVDPKAVQHRTDWRRVSPSGPVDLTWIVDYWSGTMLLPHESGHICQEVLAVTPLKIVAQHPF